MQEKDRCPFQRGEAPGFPFKRDCQFELPHEYAVARETCPVAPVTLWNGQRAWLLSRYEDYRRVLLDDRFSGEFARDDFPTVTEARQAIDKLERAFVGMDNPRHGHYRRMFMKEFTMKRMQALRPKIESLTDQLLATMADKGPPCDLVTELARRYTVQAAASSPERKTERALARALERLYTRAEMWRDLALLLEGRHLDAPPLHRRPDQRRLHELEHRPLPEGVRDDLHPPPLRRGRSPGRRRGDGRRA